MYLMILARADGGTGQLLGHACHQGFDGIQAWACSVVIYNSTVASFDPQLGVSRLSIGEVLKELLQLVYSGVVDTHGSDVKTSKFLQLPVCLQNTVIFIMHALQILVTRCNAVEANNFNGLYNCGKVSPLSPRINMDLLFTDSSKIASLIYKWVLCSSKSEHVGRETLLEMTTLSDSVSNTITTNTINNTNTDTNTHLYDNTNNIGSKLGSGCIISVHSGHNGWLHPEQLREYKRLLSILVQKPETETV